MLQPLHIYAMRTLKPTMSCAVLHFLHVGVVVLRARLGATVKTPCGRVSKSTSGESDPHMSVTTSTPFCYTGHMRASLKHTYYLAQSVYQKVAVQLVLCGWGSTLLGGAGSVIDKMLNFLPHRQMLSCELGNTSNMSNHKVPLTTWGS